MCVLYPSSILYDRNLPIRVNIYNSVTWRNSASIKSTYSTAFATGPIHQIWVIKRLGFCWPRLRRRNLWHRMILLANVHNGYFGKRPRGRHGMPMTVPSTLATVCPVAWLLHPKQPSLYTYNYWRTSFFLKNPKMFSYTFIIGNNSDEKNSPKNSYLLRKRYFVKRKVFYKCLFPRTASVWYELDWLLKPLLLNNEDFFETCVH